MTLFFARAAEGALRPNRLLGIGLVCGALAASGCSESAKTIAGFNPTGDGDGDIGTGNGDQTGDGDGDGDSSSMGDGDATGDGDSSGDGDTGSCGSIEKQSEVSRGPVDIVIALDTSGSMSDEICAVSDNLTDFANGVGPDTKVASVYQVGIDLIFQLAFLCGKEDPLAGTTIAQDPARYKYVSARVDSHNSLSVLLDQYDTYKGFLRPGAPTHFVVVTDDSSTMAATQFKSQMEAKLGHGFYFHAIAAGNGTEYNKLADLTGGQKLSIGANAGAWAALFKELEAAVVATAPLPCDFEIPETPPGEVFSAELVSVVFTPSSGSAAPFPKSASADMCADKVGWHFDDNDAPKRIKFCPAACDRVEAGGKLGISFECEPPILF